MCAGATVTIEAALAVDAIEGANFPVGWHQVDSQAESQPPAMYGAVDGTWINNRTHGVVLLELMCLWWLCVSSHLFLIAKLQIFIR